MLSATRIVLGNSRGIMLAPTVIKLDVLVVSTRRLVTFDRNSNSRSVAVPAWMEKTAGVRPNGLFRRVRILRFDRPAGRRCSS